MESDADLARYFDPAFFGVTVQIGGATVNAIFDGGYAEALGVPGTRPTLCCRSADVSGLARGTTVVVPVHGSFKVIDEQPDSSGVSRVILEKA